MEITAAIAREPECDLSIEKVELRADQLDENEILVRACASGICKTDISGRDIPLEAELPFPFMPKPVILGHEGAGIVEQVGSGVTHVKPGDRVLASFHYDSQCPSCKNNLQNYSPSYLPGNLFGTNQRGEHFHFDKDGKPLSMVHHQSSFATHMVTTRENTYLIPDDIPFEYAAPIGCGLMTGAGGVINRLKVQPGSSIAVFGCGAVGLGAIAAARREGCTSIIAVDLDDGRLDVARACGATQVVNAGESNPVEAIRALHPNGVDYSLDATGIIAVIEQAVEVLGPLGHCVQHGAPGDLTETASIPPNNLSLFGQTVSGALMGHSHPKETIEYVIDMVRKGELAMDRIVTTYAFADINQAIADAKHKVIKPVVVME